MGFNGGGLRAPFKLWKKIKNHSGMESLGSLRNFIVNDSARSNGPTWMKYIRG